VSGSRSTKSRRFAATGAAVVCFVASLVALPLSSTAFAGTTKPSQEEFRASLDAYLQNLEGALTAASRNKKTRAVVAPRLKANVKALAAAKANLSRLSGTQLDAIEAVLGLNPSWEEQPDMVRRQLSREFSTGPITAMATSSIVPGHGFLSDCSDSASLGDARGLFYSTWAAAQAAGAANAVASSLPDEVSYTPGLIVAGVAFGVANGLAIGLQDRLDRKLDCETAEFNETLISAFPVQGPLDPDEGEYTRASSQASVDRLTTAAAGIDTTLNVITTVINTTTAKLIVVINNLGLAKGNTDAIQATSMDLQARAIDLLSSVGTPTDQATYTGSEPSGTANGLANTIDTRQDTALANTASMQTLNVRLEIEETLSEAPRSSLALFALPASQGGYLETVRDIVTTTIVNELAAGQRIIGGAQEDLAAGNDALAAGQYEAAYQLYTEAYRHAVG
jgi:hypothetical protein